MKTEKILMNFILLFTISSLIIIPFIGTASATTTQYYGIDDSYYTGAKAYMSRQHPVEPSVVHYSLQGQVLTIASNITVNEIGFYVMPAATSTDHSVRVYSGYSSADIDCWIFEVTNNESVPAAPSGYLYSSTDALRTTSTTPLILDEGGEWRYWHFENIVLEAGHAYAITLVLNDGRLDSSYNFNIGHVANIVEGQQIDFGNGVFHLSSADDLIFTINNNSDYGPEATATPTPEPTATPTSQLTTLYTTLGNVFTLLIPLLVVVLPAFFGYKFAGAWGFLAGINIGAILAYTILGATVFPLWGIVVILILDALLLFGKVGFHS